MREVSKDNTRLEHIVQAIERIKRYTNGKRFDDLVEDDMMYYAVVKNIEIIGEAANLLTNEFKKCASLYTMETDYWHEKLYSTRIFSSG